MDIAMDQAEILKRIKETDTADLDPEALAEIYAHMLFYISPRIDESDLQRLILLGSVMYKNGIASRAQLQMPAGMMDFEDPTNISLQ
jgi:hypothetical protein